MKTAFFILTYNRSNVLQHCLQSLFGNTSLRPDEAWIIDDGYDIKMQHALLEMGSKAGVNLVLSTRNYGIGYSFERLYNLIYQHDDIDLACIIESDYIWRKGWLEDVQAVFDASPNTFAIAGTDHPDMYDRTKTHTTFPTIMTEIFGRDLKAREHLYIPFDLDTKLGKIKVQGVSNSCGCMILHWGRFKKVIQALEEEKVIPHGDYKRLMDRAFNKGITHDTRKNASDGYMSSIVSMYGELYHDIIGADKTRDFPFLSICDYSISQHICGGGVNGMICGEGQTFILSPTWKDEYLKESPRKTI